MGHDHERPAFRRQKTPREDVDRDLAAHEALGDAILKAAEKVDQDRARLKAELQPIIDQAGQAIQAGDHAQAATLYDGMSTTFAAAGIRMDADYWAARARDCREVVRLNSKKKGKGKRK